MNLNELIAECESLNKKATKGPWYHVDALTPEEAGIPGGTLPQVVIDSDDEEFPPIDLLSDVCKDRDYEFIARSRTLLPLLVKVIKNQQRQIDEMVQSLKVISTDWCRNRQIIARLAVKCRTEVAAELEDIK